MAVAPMPDQQIDTGGGPAIEGNVSAGKNFVGRDQIIVNPDRLTDQEVLRALYDRVAGNPMRGVPGLIGTVEDIGQSIAQLAAAQQEERRQRENLAKIVSVNRESADSKFSTLTMWVWLTLAVAGLEGVAILVMVMIRATPN